MKRMSVAIVLAFLCVFCLGAGQVSAQNAVTGEQVWQAYQNDPGTRNVGDGTKNILKKHLLKTPEILGPAMDEKLTIKTLMTAQCKFLRHMMANGYVDEIARTMPAELLEGMGGIEAVKEQLTAQLNAGLKQTEEEFIPIIGEIMAQRGQTEEQAFIAIGMNDACLEKFRTGNMTMADLLITQPTLFYGRAR